MELYTPFSSDSESDEECIEDLPLEERVLIANHFNPLEDIKENQLLDCIDTIGKYCAAIILKVHNGKCTINFEGWSSNYNEVFSLLLPLDNKGNKYEVCAF